MRCKDVRENILGYIDGDLDGQKKEDIRIHLKECNECMIEYEEIKQIHLSLKKGFKQEREGVAAPSSFREGMQSSLNEAYDDSSFKMQKSKRKRTSFKVLTATAAALIVIILTINVSPTTAYYLSKVPIVDKIIEYGVVDKGAISAVEGDVGQLIDKSSTNDNITLTVHEVVSSANRLIIMYTIDYSKSSLKPWLPRFNLKDKMGKEIVPMSGHAYIDEANGKYIGTQQFHPLNGPINRVKLFINRMEDQESRDIIQGPWEVEFYVDKSKAKGKEKKYNILKTVQGSNSSIIIDNLVTTASETMLNFTIKRNGLEAGERAISPIVKGFGEVSIIDEQGHEYTSKSMNISLTNGSMMFTLTYPSKPFKIIVKGLKEERNINSKFIINVSNVSNESVAAGKIVGASYQIHKAQINDDSLIIGFPIMKSPVEEIVKARLVNSNGKEYVWEKDNKNGLVDKIDKVANDKGTADIIQNIKFEGIDIKDTEYTLIIEKAVVYTPIAEEFIITE